MIDTETLRGKNVALNPNALYSQTEIVERLFVMNSKIDNDEFNQSIDQYMEWLSQLPPSILVRVIPIEPNSFTLQAVAPATTKIH